MFVRGEGFTAPAVIKALMKLADQINANEREMVRMCMAPACWPNLTRPINSLIRALSACAKSVQPSRMSTTRTYLNGCMRRSELASPWTWPRHSLLT